MRSRFSSRHRIPRFFAVSLPILILVVFPIDQEYFIGAFLLDLLAGPLAVLVGTLFLAESIEELDVFAEELDGG